MGIEPTSEAWEACNLTQKTLDWRNLMRFSERFNREIMENENARRADRRRRSTLNGSQSLYSISTRICPHSRASVYNGLANLVPTGPVARNQSLSLSIGLAVRGKSCHSRLNMHLIMHHIGLPKCVKGRHIISAWPIRESATPRRAGGLVMGPPQRRLSRWLKRRTKAHLRSSPAALQLPFSGLARQKLDCNPKPYWQGPRIVL